MLSKKNLVAILVDIHMLDAIVTDHSLSAYTGDLDSASIYSSIMQKYETNGESFKATLEWYSKRPDKLSEVYDAVFGELNKREQKVNDELKLFTQPGAKELFFKTDFNLVRGDTAKYPKPFLIPIEEGGTYLINVQLRMFPDDKSVNPKIVAYFCKNEKDDQTSERIIIIESIIQKSNFSRDYQSAGELSDKSYKYLKLTVPFTDKSDTVCWKNLQISSVKISRIPLPVKQLDKDVE
jgi:hypothetical protein